MRNRKLALVISSLLLGGVATAQAGPEASTSSAERQQQSTSQSDTTPGKANPEVGAPRSNVDEKATSGSYYPYSAGTVGDDPEHPKSTSAEHDGKDTATPGATSRWMEADEDGDSYLSKSELTRVNPTLAGSFDSIDVDQDGKLSRDELRNWHESNRASMDADAKRTMDAPAEPGVNDATDAAKPPIPPPGE